MTRAANVSVGPPDARKAYALVLGLLLLLLTWQLHGEWSINPQYNFGWAVPALVCYLFWKRWSCRPNPQSATFHATFLAAGCLLALLPIRIVHEANPDWRLTTWLLALVSVALGLLTVYFAGGRSWLKHFFVPVVFVLVAVPWPVALEQAVVQTLMREVVHATTEWMSLLGYAAVQRGNFIELVGGTAAIDEGCSGIRSIQTTLMVALIIGELNHLPIARRVGLIIGGFAWAILLNLIRACLITWTCAELGPATARAWHDPAGYLILGFTIAGIWAAGAWCRPRTTLQADPQPSSPEGNISEANTTLGSPTFFHGSLAPKLAWAVAAWLCLVEGMTETWYRGHEVAARESSSWTVALPSTETGFQPGELSSEIRAILRCDEDATATWQRPDGSKWTLFFLKWHPGRMAARLARGHTPDVCLPANGFKLLGGLGLTTVETSKVTLPFNTYAFESRGQIYYVFFCLTGPEGALMPDQAATAAQTYLDELTRTRRLSAARHGVRHRGQQVLEIAITGYATPREAQAALRQMLPQLIRFRS